MEMLPILRLDPGRKPVRIFPRQTDHGPKPLIPLIDVAIAIGVNRNYLFRVVRRNPKLFDGWLEPVTVTVTGSHRRNQQLLCATREGIIASLVKVSYDRIKDPAAQERIIAFQRWAIRTLTAIIDRRCPEQPFDFTDCLSLPAGRLRARAIQRLALDAGISKTTAYKQLQLARLAAGLPPSTRLQRSDAGQPKDPAAYQTVEAYWRAHPQESYRTIHRATGVPVGLCTVARWVRAWRRAAPAQHRPAEVLS